jgi:hypothetical protein
MWGRRSRTYQALTAFCRRHGISHEAKQPAGRYHFEPGQEMQHDTSPQDAMIAVGHAPSAERVRRPLLLADELRAVLPA